jgi:hypothetical protein
VHHRRDDGHHHQHDGGKLVDAQCPGDLEAARVEPGEELGDARLAGAGHVEEDDDREHRRDQQQGRGDQLRGLVADLPAEQAGDQRAEQRQEYDEDVHGPCPSPSSC